MVLLKQKCERPGFEKYYDLYLIWRHNEKVYKVRVRPVFSHDNDKLMSQAVLYEDGEVLEKYL